MSLTAGTRLGPYEILVSIGAGGMGEVYRARDPRMGRDVAIKISAERFSDRFSREVHAVAALNHPNICHLYDVGPDYLVMELVEGPTLAERIQQGAVPLEEALGIAKQIAEALEAAHEKGIVHRDLKPGNIKVRPDGTVKVLDFGLAKVADTPETGGRTEHSPTLTLDAATRVGAILGTAAYMPPEQARGKAVDKRADIWAFGVVLYEMLTGERLFEGETVSDTLIEVATKEPNWERVPAKTRRLLRRCLEKDPKRRLRDIGDAWELLEDAPQEGMAQAAPSRPRFATVAWVVAGVFAVALAIVGWGWWRSTRPIEHPLVRLDVDLGPEVALQPVASPLASVIVSPDGTRLVYVSGNPARLFTRRLDQAKATELPGTNGASGPFFSPDGQWVGFAAFSKLNKISVEGAGVVPLGNLGDFAGGSWGEDGNIIVGDGISKGLAQIPSGGGVPTPVTELASGELYHEYPQVLPGGKAVLFVSFKTTYDPENASIEVVSLADRRRKVLVQGGTSPHYLPSGHLVYTNKGTLFAIPFDLDRLETRGTAVPVLDNVAYAANSGLAHLEFAATGMLVYRSGSGTGGPAMRTIQWLDEAGKKQPLLAGNYGAPRLSPDGKRLALEVGNGGTSDVRVYDEQRDAWTRLTFGGVPHITPSWSPDGRYVVFGSSRGGGISWTRADGAGQPQSLTESKAIQLYPSFAPDGKHLAYCEFNRASIATSQLFTVPIEDSAGQLRVAGQPEQFLKDQFAHSAPAFSLDGRWLAYVSNESGMNEVYVRPFPRPASGQDRKVPISNNGGTLPAWSRNSELFYLSGDQIMAVHYTAKGDDLLPDKPRVWASKLAGVRWFDLTPDGKRAALDMPMETGEAPKPEHEVTFLFNFLDELRRRVPLGK